MIFIVDDDTTFAKTSCQALALAGHNALTFDRTDTAFAALQERDPELILCSTELPRGEGSSFRARFLERREARCPLFVYVAAEARPEEIAEALREGVDDYLVKPVDPRILVAKLEALLRLRRRGARALFRGDLSQLSIVEVLRFCEQRGLTGMVRFAGSSSTVELRCRGGQIIVDDDPAAADRLADLMQQQEGTFVIESGPIGFEEIEKARIVSLPPPSRLPATPMGRLSGVRAGARLFQLQTEYEPPPSGQVVTVVIVGGRVVTKRASRPPDDESEERLREFLDQQHLDVEREVRARLDAHQRQRNADSPPEEDSEQCVVEALRKWREKDYGEALKALERARALGADDSTLAGCMEMIRQCAGEPA